MKTKEFIQTETATQHIQLVQGVFTPSEASDVICNLINEKINFHKFQRLRDSEANHDCDTNLVNGRILELENEKLVAREFINTVKLLGKSLTINGTLEIKIES